jgi:hypothetical protein
MLGLRALEGPSDLSLPLLMPLACGPRRRVDDCWVRLVILTPDLPKLTYILMINTLMQDLRPP